MKPTEEQVREFWEKLGVQLEHEWTDDVSGYRITDCICEVCRKSDWPPAQDKRCYPPIDLNNLFKWAVPKLRELDFTGVYFLPLSDGRWHVKVDILRLADDWGNEVQDPALALFWAIYKVREEK